MADYHSLLMRAVANLPSAGTAATRDAIYGRARKALIEQLRSLRPPLPESDIAREANALDAAIAKIEAEYGAQDGAPSSPRSPGSTPPGGKPGFSPSSRPAAPAVAPQQAAPPSPRPPGQVAPAQPATQQRPATPVILPTGPATRAPASSTIAPRPGAPAGSPAAPQPALASSGNAGAPQRPPPAPARVQPAANSPAYGQAALAAKASVGTGATATAPVQDRSPPAIQKGETPPARESKGRVAPAPRSSNDKIPSAPLDVVKTVRASRADDVHAPGAPPVVATRPDEPVQPGAAPEVSSEIDRPGAGAKLDLEGQRPVVPSVNVRRPSPWLWIAGAVVLGVVLTVAGAAIVMRQKPQDLAIKAPVETAEPPAVQPPAKIAERVEAAPQTPAAPAANAGGEPKPEQPAGQGPAPANPAPEVQNAAAPAAASGAAAPSAGRAAMLVASADNPQKPVVSLGSTVWSLIPPAPGQPATVAVKAEADIPDLKMHATMTLRKNTDPTLQATHTIDLKFSFAEGAPITGFKDVGLPQMRKEDSTAAEALTSVKVKISDTYFLIALAKGDADTARNLDLMQTRAWFDFPLLLNDDRIAKVVFQKSPEGQAMLEKAFEAWK